MGAVFNLEGSGSGALKAVEDLNKALDAMEKKADKAAVGTKKAEEAAKKLAAQADPQERYNQRMAKLAEAVHNGGLEIGKAETLANRYGAALANAGKAGDDALGARFVSMISSAAAGAFSFATVVATIANAFRDVEEASKRSVEQSFTALGAFGELQQLGPEGMRRGLGIAEGLIRSGAVAPGNRAQAANIASDLINAGFSDQEIGFVTSQLAGTKKVAAENLVGVGGNLRKLQRNFGETDLESVTGRLMAAAAETQANLAVTTREVVKFAPLASSVGVSLDEAAAAFAVSEQRSASPEAAAENLKSFFSQVFRRDLSDGDLQQTLDSIAKKVEAKGGNAFEVLGDANAVIGYQQLTRGRAQLDAFERAFGGAAFDRSDLLATNPKLAALQIKSQAEGELAVTSSSILDERQALIDAVRARQEQARRRDDLNPMLQGALDYFTGLFEGATPNDPREELRLAVPGLDANDPLRQQILDYLRRTAESSERTERTRRATSAVRQE